METFKPLQISYNIYGIDDAKKLVNKKVIRNKKPPQFYKESAALGARVSVNFTRGNVIFSTDYLMKMVAEKKSVYHKHWGVKPASFFASMQFSLVYRMIIDCYIFKIEKI